MDVIGEAFGWCGLDAAAACRFWIFLNLDSTILSSLPYEGVRPNDEDKRPVVQRVAKL